MSQVLRSMTSMLPAAASSVKLPDHKLIDHRLDVVQLAHQLFQRFRLLFAPDTALERYPPALAFGPDAGVSEATVSEDSLLDAWNDLLVVEIRVRKPAAPGQEATCTAFNPYVPLGSHLSLCDHWTLRHRTVGDPSGNLKKGIVEVIRALFGQGRPTDERCRHGSEQYWFQGSCAMPLQRATIVVLNRDSRKIDAFKAVNVDGGHRIAFWVRAFTVRRNAADRTKPVLDGVLVERIGARRIFRREDMKLLSRNGPKQRTLALAD